METACREEVRTACAVAGIEVPPKPVQYLRSTFAAMAAAAGVSELALAATMGHQSITTTRKFYVAARKARQAAEAHRRVQQALDAARAELGDQTGDTSAAGRPAERVGGKPPAARN